MRNSRGQSSIIVMIAIIAIFFLFLSSISYYEYEFSQIGNAYKNSLQLQLDKSKEALEVQVFNESTSQTNCHYKIVITNIGTIGSCIIGIYAIYNQSSYVTQEYANPTFLPVNQSEELRITLNQNGVTAFFLVTAYGNAFISPA
ncbi:hypothetical protein HS7_15400 [Sulfolobales archaeon HS-7]|nr:hypothetical protein HS7_15400 [Sulfolobales archaeon HS-7]